MRRLWYLLAAQVGLKGVNTRLMPFKVAIAKKAYVIRRWTLSRVVDQYESRLYDLFWRCLGLTFWSFSDNGEFLAHAFATYALKKLISNSFENHNAPIRIPSDTKSNNKNARSVKSMICPYNVA